MKTDEIVIARKVKLGSKSLQNVDESILRYLTQEIEGRCEAKGYVKKVKSIKERSFGINDVDSLDGEVLYDVWFLADIISIKVKDILFGCTITTVRRAGIFLEKDNFIQIYISSKYLENDFESRYVANQKLNIRVIGVDCSFGRKKIEVMGIIHWYYIPKKVELLVEFNMQDPVKKLKLDIRTVDLGEVKNLERLGYDDCIGKLKKRIDDISEPLWNYYKLLLNPFELISPQSGYIERSEMNKERSEMNKERSEVSSIGKKVPSRAYFKLWEILNQFPNLIPSRKINVATFCEAPGGFVKAIIDFRRKNFSEVWEKDRYLVMTLIGKDEITFSRDLMKMYGKMIELNPGNCDCDITKYKTISACEKVFKKRRADLVTGDGGIRTSGIDFDQEREMMMLKFGEIIAALTVQEDGGTFILKVFDLFTEPMSQMLYLVALYYNKVQIYKPQMSRPASSEKYLIATGFRGIDEHDLVKLQDILKKGIKFFGNLLDISGYNEDQYKIFLNTLRVYNHRMLDLQCKKITEIVEIIRLNDYQKLKDPSEYIKKQKEIATMWEHEN